MKFIQLFISILCGIVLAGLLGYIGKVPFIPFITMLVIGGIGGAAINLFAAIK